MYFWLNLLVGLLAVTMLPTNDLHLHVHNRGLIMGVSGIEQCSSTFFVTVHTWRCFDELMHPIYWRFPVSPT